MFLTYDCPRPIVLVVEDEPLILMDAVAMVEEAGFEALEACNADEAIAILDARSDIRVILTDIDMPGSMDGLKLAHHVRGRWPPIDIIVVSGDRSVGSADMPERGVFFAKPYSRTAVAAELMRFTA